MKYSDVIKNLKDKEKEVEIHYYSDGCRTTYSIDVDGDIDIITHQTMKKIYGSHEVKEFPYGIEGSEETGYLRINLKETK